MFERLARHRPYCLNHAITMLTKVRKMMYIFTCIYNDDLCWVLVVNSPFQTSWYLTRSASFARMSIWTRVDSSVGSDHTRHDSENVHLRYSPHMLICLSSVPQPRLPPSTSPSSSLLTTSPLPRGGLASFATHIFDRDSPPLPGSTSAQRYFRVFMHFYLQLIWFVFSWFFDQFWAAMCVACQS